MKRLNALVLLGWLGCGWMAAQGLTAVTVGTNPSGAAFIVDGTVYTSTQVFEWPIGGAHVVQFPFSQAPTGSTSLGYQIGMNGAIEYGFDGWTDNEGLLTANSSPIITITADAGLSALIASVTVYYEVNVTYYSSSPTNPGSCTGAPGTGGPAFGVVYIDGACVAGSTTAYLTAGSHSLNAFPYPGWVFWAWDINGNTITGALATFTVSGPTTISPEFSIAKVVQFLTNPLGLTVLVDGATIQTPASGAPASQSSCTAGTTAPSNAPTGFPVLCVGQMDFLAGSTHHLGAASPQYDANGNPWVFSSYASGAGQNSIYTADMNTSTVDTQTANFAPGTIATFTTLPNGLPLTVDGRTNWPAYNFVWGQGETHTISAPAQSTDSAGRVWVFSAWSNGGPASQTLTVGTSGISMVATYTELDQVTVTSNPPGLTFEVNGNTCTTPCSVSEAAGAQTLVTIPGSVNSTQSSQYAFTSWSDGSTSLSRTVPFSQNSLTLVANYQASYLLAAAAYPSGSATFQFSPASANGFYASGTQVAVTAVPANGYTFGHWSGDISGTYYVGSVSMTTPHSIIANMSGSAANPPLGIETAAGPTPDGGVAAGSLIAIYGQNLAPSFQVGPSNPLSQSIDGVAVTINNQILPLLYVAPGQIAAQVPWELAPGTYNVQVQPSGQAASSGTITVERDDPAIFTQPNTQNLPLILALHQDGSVVTLASPALHDEQISIYCTGFGPYDQAIPDGFPPNPANTYTIVDPVTINAGALQIQPDSAEAANGMVGMTVVKMTITSAFPSATTMNLTITVNGKISSPVTLPLQ